MPDNFFFIHDRPLFRHSHTLLLRKKMILAFSRKRNSKQKFHSRNAKCDEQREPISRKTTTRNSRRKDITKEIILFLNDRPSSSFTAVAAAAAAKDPYTPRESTHQSEVGGRSSLGGGDRSYATVAARAHASP